MKFPDSWLAFPATGLVVLTASLFVACGDTVENTTINQTGLEVVDSEDDLPECTDDNEGDQAIVKGENFARVCLDGDWVALNGPAGEDFSCKTVELKDKSGLKIVCNGDSIGVVLNGSDGKAGTGCAMTDKTDSTMTVVCGDSTMVIELGTSKPDSGIVAPDTTVGDSEQVSVSLDSLAGYTQKGPFLKGSTVYLYELSDGRTLKQTNGNFTSKIAQDNGRYKFIARDLVSQYAMIVVEGYYRNEVTGDVSNAPIRLSALTDVRKHSSVNVNLLTQLEFDRVYYLVTHEKKTVKNAKRQAQQEILKEFHIELDDKTDAEDMDVFGLTDADAALLAISILLQGDRSEAELASLLSEISNDMAEDGKWNDPLKNVDSIKAEMANWALKADFDGAANGLARFSENVSNWHLGNTVPDFEKYVRNFYSIESGLGICGSKDAPVDTVKNVPSRFAENYYASDFLDTTITKTRFICKEKAGVRSWRIASDIEKDTASWGGDTVGAVRNGQINANLVYVYEEDGWRHGTVLDSLLVKAGGKACLKDGDTSSVKYDNLYYVCETQSTPDTIRKWVYAPDFYNATYDFRSGCANRSYRDGRLFAGILDSNSKFVCDDGVFRDADSTEAHGGLGCTGYNRDKLFVLKGQYSFYRCTENGWEFTLDTLNRGTLTDNRVNPVKYYKTIGIKGQNWMAENLNYKVDSSFCYGKNDANCEKYGRLYSWAGAVGKRELECGMGFSCVFSGKVQGVCPAGWHIPDTTEWNTLIEAVGGAVKALPILKATTGWDDYEGNSINGTDDYGFAMLPAGSWSFDSGTSSSVGKDGTFWSSSEYNVRAGYALRISNRSTKVSVSGLVKNYGFSVRCVMD